MITNFEIKIYNMNYEKEVTINIKEKAKQQLYLQKKSSAYYELSHDVIEYLLNMIEK